MKILIFLHGTTIMHKGALGRTRDERVRQVLDGNESLYDFASYVPVGNAAQKLCAWEQQGAEILYLSSHVEVEKLEKDKLVLKSHGFPEGQILLRHSNETYSDVAEIISPDILIEDDCESIGGEEEMTYPHIRSERKARIKWVKVKEFGGIDHLPDNLSALMNFEDPV